MADVATRAPEPFIPLARETTQTQVAPTVDATRAKTLHGVGQRLLNSAPPTHRWTTSGRGPRACSRWA
eukprot:6197636-Lingulodinium_polyedra.AAC.1